MAMSGLLLMVLALGGCGVVVVAVVVAIWAITNDRRPPSR